MPIPAIYDLTIIQGADTQRRFALRTPAGTVMDLATTGYIAVTAAISSGLTDWGDGVWDLEISDGLHVYRIAQGQCFLDPSVSE